MCKLDQLLGMKLLLSLLPFYNEVMMLSLTFPGLLAQPEGLSTVFYVLLSYLYMS